MEQHEEEKNLPNDDLVLFMRKQSETEVPRYTAQVENYLYLKKKQQRAAAARRNAANGHKKHNHGSKNKTELEPPAAENTGKAGYGSKIRRARSVSRESYGEPCDRCRRRRYRRRSCRRRRRSRCRRRRRRRSRCRRRRRSRCRRRRRSRCRRRRRRSCGRRRRRYRRRRRC